MRRLLLVLALVACEKKPRPPETTASGSAIDALVVVPAIDATATTFDAAEPEQLKTAEWPSALEITEIEVEGNGRSNDYFHFRTRPPELGNAMNAWFKTFADSAKSKRTAEQHCTLSTSSRIAVIGFCTHMNEWEGTGGAPAGPDPTFFAWWMQPGLPAVTAEQLAPGVDFKALFAQTYAAAPKDCPLEHCTFEPGSFRLDDAGLTFESSEYCYADCLRPRVPIESLQPTHPWAKKLVEFLRQQIEKGEPVVKYVVKQP